MIQKEDTNMVQQHLYHKFKKKHTQFGDISKQILCISFKLKIISLGSICNKRQTLSGDFLSLYHIFRLVGVSLL